MYNRASFVGVKSYILKKYRFNKTMSKQPKATVDYKTHGYLEACHLDPSHAAIMATVRGP